MADLTVRSDDRGQLIIVAAVGLAILLTLLTLALNTAVFGGIHAAQTDDSLNEERGVIEYQDGLERGVGGMLAPLNRKYDEYDTLESELNDSVAAWSDLSRSERLREGTAATASLRGVSYETRVVQNESGTFADRSGDPTWEVAANVSDVRGFEANVTKTGLVDGGGCVDDGSCFTVEVEGADGNAWRLFAYDDGGVEVFVDPASGANETYAAGAEAELNVTDGTVNGSKEFPSFLEDGGLAAPYTVRYANADDVSGTYELTVDGRIVDGSIADDDRYGLTGSPRIEARIAAAEVGLRYRSPDLLYETNTTVASGESDG